MPDRGGYRIRTGDFRVMSPARYLCANPRRVGTRLLSTQSGPHCHGVSVPMTPEAYPREG